ncbi:MAG: carbamate kinase [Nitrospina sp.]|jgi:carbamate kinase|nr:carbamate kinase [Nitrospina sp.]MBT3413566.1 carbamate kinase [Nitrospina sp.]MBT3856776.1 carbamate kinase [Nitrospina sp.]MBT4104801.1 carbamate kinase [Nitrospina sp.]MBT4388332.1 carbamate kinase [Nitrospina sp.]
MSDHKPSLLISFGGNALNVPDQAHAHQNEEFVIAKKSMEQVVELLKAGYQKMVLTHGNGPQVGQIFLQQELTKDEFPRQVTLDVCVADSQGRIGYILQNVFDNACQEQGINKKSSAIITQVLVDPADPAFQHPTKPIGVFYSPQDAEKLIRERGWQMGEDAGRGFRRLVASPKPVEIIEKALFSKLLESGFIVIGGGGGGIPVIRKPGGELVGVEAVIDKDHTSALLANKLGVDCLVILTEVEYVFLNYNSPTPEPIHQVSVKVMEKYLQAGEFAEGSMKPKVEAVLKFLKSGGKRAIIAGLFNLARAVEGQSGTHILVD